MNRLADPTLSELVDAVAAAVDVDRFDEVDRVRGAFLEAGALAEFGEPADLLKDKTGLFTKLVEQSGKKNSEHLIGLSNAAKERRQSAQNLREVQEAAEEAHHEGSP